MQYNDIATYYIPIADTGDCTEGVTVTLIGLLDTPPVILTMTSINPLNSEPLYCPDANPTSTNNTYIHTKWINTVQFMW